MEVFARKPGGKDWEKLKLVNATADFSEPQGKPGDKKNAVGSVATLVALALATAAAAIFKNLHYRVYFYCAGVVIMAGAAMCAMLSRHAEGSRK